MYTIIAKQSMDAQCWKALSESDAWHATEAEAIAALEYYAPHGPPFLAAAGQFRLTPCTYSQPTRDALTGECAYHTLAQGYLVEEVRPQTP